MLQGSLFGLVGLLPQKFSAIFMSGQGLAGTFAAIAMLLAIASEPPRRTQNSQLVPNPWLPGYKRTFKAVVELVKSALGHKEHCLRLKDPAPAWNGLLSLLQ